MLRLPVLIVRLGMFLLLFWPCVSSQTMESQGVLVLEQVIASAGGRNAVKNLTDFRASGTFSLYSAGEVMDTGPATLVGSGLKRFRMTATLNHETRTWLWRDGDGVLSVRDNSAEAIGRHNLAVLEGITTPVQRLIALLDDSTRSVQLVDRAEPGTKKIYCIRIVETPATRQAMVALGRHSLIADIMIDPQTFQILAIQDTIHPNTSTADVFTHKVTYGDYHSVAGVLMPFLIKEEISGQLTWALRIDSLDPDARPAGSEFTLK